MKNADKKLFWIGTFFLYIAMLILTVLPVFISSYISFIYVDASNYKNTAAVFFAIALVLYLLSKTTFKRQLLTIALAFCYFYIYINFFTD